MELEDNQPKDYVVIKNIEKNDVESLMKDMYNSLSVKEKIIYKIQKYFMLTFITVFFIGLTLGYILHPII